MASDFIKDLVQHKQWVAQNMQRAANALFGRAAVHDNSKFESEEFELYDKLFPELQKYAYGSPELKAVYKQLGPALKHHLKVNRHHPEFHEDGINDMNLIDVLEMVCDWMAASKRSQMLKKSPTFRPFVGQSIMLTLITKSASNDQIIRVIGATSANRNDMIDMELDQLFMAVVAFLALPLILLLDLLRRMLPSDSLLTGRPISVIREILFRIGLTILQKPVNLIFVMFFAQRLLLLMVFLKISIAITRRFLAATLSAIVAYTARLLFLRIKVFWRSGESLFTNCTLSCVFWRLRGFRGRAAIFTNWMQSIDASRMFMEVFGSCGFLLLALSAAFQYNIHAVRTSNSYRHAQGCVQHRLGTVIFGELIIA